MYAPSSQLPEYVLPSPWDTRVCMLPALGVLKVYSPLFPLPVLTSQKKVKFAFEMRINSQIVNPKIRIPTRIWSRIIEYNLISIRQSVTLDDYIAHFWWTTIVWNHDSPDRYFKCLINIPICSENEIARQLILAHDSNLVSSFYWNFVSLVTTSFCIRFGWTIWGSVVILSCHWYFLIRKTILKMCLFIKWAEICHGMVTSQSETLTYSWSFIPTTGYGMFHTTHRIIQLWSWGWNVLMLMDKHLHTNCHQSP
jgi:hypothetical protein